MTSCQFVCLLESLIVRHFNIFLPNTILSDLDQFPPQLSCPVLPDYITACHLSICFSEFPDKSLSLFLP